MSMIKNRIEKNFKKLRSWADQQRLEAYRLYDRDIPEFPFIIDRYKNFYLVYDRTDPKIDQDKNQLPLVQQALIEIFDSTVDQIIVKKRERQEGHSQYEKLSDKGERLIVQEGPARFWVNLYDYLDTGLFLDHRPLRKKIADQCEGKTFLNLFCYTGSFSVIAALSGARTTSVDMSRTYLDWLKDNFTLNGVDLSNHRLIQSDVLQYLADKAEEEFDIIYLDPPTFSKSKRMETTFEVERDQEFLIKSTMKRLKADGTLYFSTNKRNFRLLPSLTEKFFVKDISLSTIPMDFHDKKIHQAYIIRHKRSS